MSIVKTVEYSAFVVVTLAFAMNAHAARGSTESTPTDQRLGDHPAVVVQRLHEKQAYDYVSKFYPHPAWLFLRAESAQPAMAHPPVEHAAVSDRGRRP